MWLAGSWIHFQSWYRASVRTHCSAEVLKVSKHLSSLLLSQNPGCPSTPVSSSVTHHGNTFPLLCSFDERITTDLQWHFACIPCCPLKSSVYMETLARVKQYFPTSAMSKSVLWKRQAFVCQKFVTRGNTSRWSTRLDSAALWRCKNN